METRNEKGENKNYVLISRSRYHESQDGGRD